MIERNVFLSKRLARQQGEVITSFADWAPAPTQAALLQTLAQLMSSGYRRSRAEPGQGRCIINKEYSSVKKRMRRMRRFGDVGWEK